MLFEEMPSLFFDDHMKSLKTYYIGLSSLLHSEEPLLTT